MFLKINLKNEIYKNLEKFCKENKLEINDFIEKTILEKIEMEIIKKNIKSKSNYDLLEENIEDNMDILDYHIADDNKFKH